MTRRTSRWRRWVEGWIMAGVEWGLRRWVGGLCWSFGGLVWPPALTGPAHIQVRVCLKPRWHTDSHAYDIVDPTDNPDPRAWRLRVGS